MGTTFDGTEQHRWNSLDRMAQTERKGTVLTERNNADRVVWAEWHRRNERKGTVRTFREMEACDVSCLFPRFYFAGERDMLETA